jgi:MFS family permease
LCACGGLLAAGTADFALISYHFARTRTAGPTAIPMLYAAAMAVEGVAALLLGFLLQRTGARALLLTIAISSAAAPMLFLGVVPPLWAVVAWSIGMGGQYALLRALVPAHVKPGARGAAFGWFNTVFGVFWFAGSATLGLMYGRSIGAMVFIAVVLQLAAIPLVLLLSVTSLDSSRTPRAARRVTTAERR